MGLVDSLRGLFGGGRSGELECVACGSKQLTLLAADAYHCEGCGYEGGDGYAAYRLEVERARLKDVDDEALLGRVREGLESARLSLLALSESEQSPELSRGWRIAVSIGSEVLGANLLEVGTEEREQDRGDPKHNVSSAHSSLLKTHRLFEDSPADAGNFPLRRQIVRAHQGNTRPREIGSARQSMVPHPMTL